MAEIATRLALGRMQLGRPTTYGGVIKNRALLETTFKSQTLPDVQPRTRIIAVCGATDDEDFAAPTKDGWFFSDFYAFNYLLKGQGASQTWLTTESPQDLVSKYTEYLHGPSSQGRKVVLDAALLKDNTPQNTQVVDRYDLLENFLSTVRRECDHARVEKEPVLVLLFAHGERESKGVFLGLTEEEMIVPGALLEMDVFRNAVGNNVEVCVLSTACYSGGWAVNPQLNTTTMAAAAPGGASNVEFTGASESWTPSRSINRVCGSIYDTAVIKALAAEDAPLLAPGEDPGTSSSAASSKQERANTFSTYAATIYQTLFTRVDRLAVIHGIRFSAQDDEWSMEWHRRTGFSLDYYAAKWDQLREVPLRPEDTQLPSRDPATPGMGEGLSQYPRGAIASRGFGQEKISGLLTGSLLTIRSLVTSQVRLYLRSLVGRDTLAPNVSLHNTINRLLRGEPINFNELNWIHTILEYRLKAMDAVDLYVGALGLAGPNGQRCCQWSMTEWKKTDEAQDASDQKLSKILDAVMKSKLIPGPNRKQGQNFTKPEDYLAVALLVSRQELPQIEAMLEELVAIKESVITQHVEELSRFRTIRTAGRSYFATLGKRLRSLSPVKRSQLRYPPLSPTMPRSPKSPKSAGKSRRMSLFERSDGSREE